LRGELAGIGSAVLPVYNLVPSPGYAAAFGAAIAGKMVIQSVRLIGSGSSGATRLISNLPVRPAVLGVEEEIWGTPADPAHDAQRTCVGPGSQGETKGCAAGVPERPLLTVPAACDESPRATLVVSSYDTPPETVVTGATLRDGGGNPYSLVGCDAVPFRPGLRVTTAPATSAPTAFGVEVEAAQYEGIENIGAAPIGALKVVLPKGVTLNSAAGSWLTGCSPAGIGLESPPRAEEPVFDESPANCPSGSRLGSVTVQTPLVDHDLDGTIYLATPSIYPPGASYAIYIVIEDAATGTLLKIPGRLDADPTDGRLKATIPEMPPLPFTELRLEFSGGARAPLVNPPTCGTYSTETTFTPSTAPFGRPITRTSTFVISAGAEGKSCPSPEAERPAAPSFQAGTESGLAGGGSPLVIDLSREDGDQQFGTFEVTLPPGLIANIGSTPIGTVVGSARVEAGVGTEPLSVDGTVYVGGPYEGAPYSLAIVVSGREGLLELGSLVERVAVDVDAATAQISARADPLPLMLEGVPLQLRGLRIDLDRPGFIRNPTDCEPMAITGTATTSLGQMAPLFSRFQVGECAVLSFNPKISLRLFGAKGRGGHPGVRAVMSDGEGEATPASVGFTLPAGELLDLRRIRGLCPRSVAADWCPRSSRLGSVRLESSFLPEPLGGSLYLRAPRHRLPGLVAALRSSSGSLGFDLYGRTTAAHGRLGVRLGSLPDVPLSRAVLTLAGGYHGILVNSRSLCRKRGDAQAAFAAHSGRTRRLHVLVGVGGCRRGSRP